MTLKFEDMPGVKPEGSVFSFAGSRFLSPPADSTAFTLLQGPDRGLATVFTIDKSEASQLTSAWLRDAIKTYRSQDDVFDEHFLDTVVFQGVSRKLIDYTDEAQDYLTSLGNQKVIFTPERSLLPGPYAIIDKQLRDVWKLVDDSYDTCMTTLEPRSHQSAPFAVLQASSIDGHHRSFALQSRLKAQAVHKSPLAGMRIVIKDNIHLHGIKTSVGNRAFCETYPVAAKSADCIQKLVDCGVSVVGKAKMTSFGNWEEPIEYVDYQAPWNPRADRYQSPGGSSSGPASAIAAYEWLDVAIGTDTWGSVTRPALWCGCFGLRPSTGAVPGKGVVPYVPLFDTAGILATDLNKCKTFATEWLDHNVLGNDSAPLTSIIWPTDFWNIMSPKEVEIARNFSKLMESSLRVPLEEVSYQKLWETSPPAEAGGMSLSEYIEPAASAQDYDAYHNYEDFRTKHYEKFGFPPYTTPRNQKSWLLGSAMSKAERDAKFRAIEIYRQWLHDTVLVGQHSNALTILPLEPMGPRYRDQVPDFLRPPQQGINSLAIAAVMRSPVLAVPIAELPFHSIITEREERLPFSVAIMSMPGTDLALLDVVRRVLDEAGLPTALKTGTSVFA